MNIFYLDRDPKIAAKYHCNAHNLKMIVESFQLLSTAHRVLDGTPSIILSDTGRKKKIYTHPDSELDSQLYLASHINHPDAIWIRESALNYLWTYNLAIELNQEFIKRYNKTQDHLSIKKLGKILGNLPKALIIENPVFTDPPQCMPDECKTVDTVQAYHNYYNMKKRGFARWKNNQIPDWFAPEITDQNLRILTFGNKQ